MLTVTLIVKRELNKLNYRKGEQEIFRLLNISNKYKCITY